MFAILGGAGLAGACAPPAGAGTDPARAYAAQAVASQQASGQVSPPAAPSAASSSSLTTTTTSASTTTSTSSSTSTTSGAPVGPPAPATSSTESTTIATAGASPATPAAPSPVSPVSPGPGATSGATGPTASGSAATRPDDGSLFSSGPILAGGASAPGSAIESGGTQAPAATLGGAIGAAASGVAASAVAAALPPAPFTGVLVFTDPFASVADAVLGYFRIPLFLLPIYQAAGDEYGVPWQVLAAINEIETDYGHDLNVSSAGALGWMQFLPTTWMLYGVDATASGAADPYNPADAIFAAARLLRDAGARTNLTAAVFAYNHSSAYVASVLLRARLIQAYPASLIDSLTTLSIGVTPVHDTDVRSVEYGPAPRPVSVPAPAPAGAAPTAARPHRTASVPVPAPLTLITTPGARVLAVRDGRVVHEGVSAALGGAYLTLRDADGNHFTYGHLSRRAVYGPEHPPQWHPLGVGATVRAGAVIGEVGGTSSIGMLRFVVRPGGDQQPVDPLPYLDSWAMRAQTLAPSAATVAPPAPAGTTGPVAAPAAGPAVSVLGTLAPSAPSGARAGAAPGPIAAAAAAPRARAAALARARAATDLFTWGSTTIFFAATGALEHAVLADRHVGLPACERARVAAHRIDRRVLAVLEYLSQSGFTLGVDRSSCGVLPVTGVAARARSASLDVSSVNGSPVAARPSANSVTGLVFARLRALYGEFVPQSVLDVASSATLVAPGRGTPHELRVSFAVAGARLPRPPSPAQAAAARVPALDAPLTTLEWSQVTARLAAIRNPGLEPFPSIAATMDRAARTPSAGR